MGTRNEQAVALGLSLPIIEFCAWEVQRQRDTPVHVSHMLSAWHHAMYRRDVDGLVPMETDVATIMDFVLRLGSIVKPSMNGHGFRKHSIQIGHEIRDNQGVIVQQLWGLFDALNEGRIGSQELYLEFEIIHPFGDGNGRTGKILFNWANGTLDNPVMPENPYGWAIP